MTLRGFNGLMLAACFAAGCSSRMVNVAPLPPTEYSEIGPSSGEACGLLLFSMFPMSMNDRVERAYAQALQRVEGTSLTDTVLTDRWYFALLGPVVCTQVEGLALRRVEGASTSSNGSSGETTKRPRGEPISQR